VHEALDGRAGTVGILEPRQVTYADRDDVCMRHGRGPLPGGVRVAEEVAQAGNEGGGLLDVRERLPVEAP
jgi:hypothetical protein